MRSVQGASLSTLESQGVTHTPVLFKETIEMLNIRPGGRYIDCTLGGGGHGLGVLEASGPGGRLLGLDADPEAVFAAERRLEAYRERLVLAQRNFREILEQVKGTEFCPSDGIMMDLGMSSLQLDVSGRGFSFQRNGPLDMRFDTSQELKASDVVNRFNLDKLSKVLAEFGEVPRPKKIASAIIASRPIESTSELAGLLQRIKGNNNRKVNPATQTFQAIRIAVNRELENLEIGITDAIKILGPGKRLIVISYHSLEDRIVKGLFRRAASECVCPPRTPVCICNHIREVRLITKKPIFPTPLEIMGNPRSRSARMRVAERV